MGVREFVATSDGNDIDPVNAYRKHEKKLALIQRGMSRKRKFGSNWKRDKQRLRRLHGKIADIRLDHLHKASTSICKNHAVVVVEDLKIRDMTASAKGTKANPGSLVKVKSRFNKAILDQGWFEFRRQLEYKEVWLQGEVVAVSPEGTSTTCPECGVDDALNRPNLRKWFECVSCGHREHSGTVAAKNLLKRAGYARIACQVSGASMPPAAGTHRSDYARVIPCVAQ